MKNPSDYKSDYGLYRATMKVMDQPLTVKNAWWLENALYECKMSRKELYHQLKDLIHPSRKHTIEDLNTTNSYYIAES